jgi:hypothetical protein
MTKEFENLPIGTIVRTRIPESTLVRDMIITQVTQFPGSRTYAGRDIKTQKQWLFTPSDIIELLAPVDTVTIDGIALTPPAPSANDIQVGGDHYKSRKIQVWDFVVENGLGFLEGNVVKYVSRFRQKGGVDDLRKAEHYLKKLIEVEENK